MIYIRAAVLLAGLLTIALHYLPGRPDTLPAGMGLCFAALGWQLLAALNDGAAS